MYSTEYLLIQYVVYAANVDDPETVITLNYDGAISILRAVTSAIDEVGVDCNIDFNEE
jgi:hypothetical protein